MKNQQVDKSQLLPNVQIVPDGIGEIAAGNVLGGATSRRRTDGPPYVRRLGEVSADALDDRRAHLRSGGNPGV